MVKGLFGVCLLIKVLSSILKINPIILFLKMRSGNDGGSMVPIKRPLVDTKGSVG